MSDEEENATYEEAREAEREAERAVGRQAVRMLVKVGYGPRLTSWLQGFAAQLAEEHRTHQADVIRALTRAVSDYADAESDLRNTAAVSRARAVRAACEDYPVPRF